MKKLLKYLRGYRFQSVLAPLFKMLEAIFELLIPLVVASIIDTGIRQNNMRHIYAMCGVMILLGVVGFISSISAQFFAARAAVGFSRKLRSSLFSHIMGFDRPTGDKLGTSTLINRMTGDINTVQTGVNMFLRLFMRSPFIVFGAMIMAFTISTNAALIFAVAIPALALVVFGIMLITIPIYKKSQAGLDRILDKTRSNYLGTRVIRAFNKEKNEIKEFGEQTESLYKTQIFAGRISSLMNPLTYAIINLAVVMLIKNGAIYVNEGSITQGELVALYNYMSQILIELIKLANLIILLNRTAASASRIQNVFDTPQKVIKSAKKKGSDPSLAVEFDNVSFGYNESGAFAVSGVSFKVKKGQTVGIIGGTGSGKSTLVNLIPGFYNATEGSVFVNGKNVLEYDKDEIREKFGIVPQKPQLFKGTVRSNLEWGKNGASDGELWTALEKAQAGDFIAEKSEKLDEAVLQNGKNFSGGQRQRLTVARALVRKPEILILDDSASALDYATESRLRKEIKNLDFYPTTFIVSQRTSSVIQSDLILVLEDGRIQGAGSHMELLKTCEVYKEIYLSQFPDEGSEQL